MSDQGELYETSWILYHILDRYIGSQEEVADLRKLTVISDQLWRASKTKGCKCDVIYTGSHAEGIQIEKTNKDHMFIDRNVIVKCPDMDISSQLDSANKTVFIMREAKCRPGYVHLELVHLGKTIHKNLKTSLVTVGDVTFISSERYTRTHCRSINVDPNTAIDGPAIATKTLQCATGYVKSIEVRSFPCYNWPKEANEWVSRPRLHDWPDKVLTDQIIQGGCYLVPVGDNMSSDQFIQWRISFTNAEKKLVHSFTHVQFLVYGLLKQFFKQLSELLKQMVGEADILSSYIAKTIMFYAAENTTKLFWQEKHMFLCFLFCLNILVNWVNAGHCPNYFVKTNNMFCGRIHGQTQRKLLFLTNLLDMKWECLSVGTVIQPSIGERINAVRKGLMDYMLPPPSVAENWRDRYFFKEVLSFKLSSGDLSLSLEPLLKSNSDIDEFIWYFTTVQALSRTGMELYREHITATGNKEKYKSLRKCKNFLKLFATVSSCPVLLTFYYQTGNYMKTLEMCGNMITLFKMYPDMSDSVMLERYKELYCGRGYSFLRKCQAFSSDIIIPKQATHFCPTELHPEITKVEHGIRIPPLPYAMFLSFLCYHHLGDTRKRESSLTDLRCLKSDKAQGCRNHWIVHNILGICYEIVGDIRGALREYKESLKHQGIKQHQNAAKERIEHLQRPLQLKKANTG